MLLSNLQEATNTTKADRQTASILLKQFSQGLRPLDSCERVIHQFLDNSDSKVKTHCQEEYAFLRDCVSTNKSSQTLVELYKLTGKKALTQQARTHLTTLLEKAYLD